MTDEEAAVQKYGSIRAAAGALGVPYTTFHDRYVRAAQGAVPTGRSVSPRRRRQPPRITRASLHEALMPPNRCRVAAFLAALDEASREVLNEALSYDRAEFSAGALRAWLIDLGFAPDEVPGNDAINDHRSGRRPCRCRG